MLSNSLSSPRRPAAAILKFIILNGLLLFLALIACAVGAAALGSAAGLVRLPHPLAVLDERMPVLFRAHMAAGGLGFLLYPWAVLLRGLPWAHRRLGQISGGLLFVAAVVALPCALASTAMPIARVGFFVMGLMTLALVWAGARAIWRGDRERHARLMVQVGAMAYGVVVLRVMMVYAPYLEVEFDDSYAVIAWISWGIPLTLAHIATRLWPPRREFHILGQ